jgi:hypothetical protein
MRFGPARRGRDFDEHTVKLQGSFNNGPGFGAGTSAAM